MTSTMESACTRELVRQLLEAVDGELSSRSRVVDGLLDLRNSAPAGSSLKIRVDELLAGIPGLTTVPNGWWVDRLEELRDLT
ncbi:MAG: hypothetical protein ACC660_00605 [Acidimicrobiales bacterium]